MDLAMTSGYDAGPGHEANTIQFLIQATINIQTLVAFPSFTEPSHFAFVLINDADIHIANGVKLHPVAH